jgi:transposase
MTEPVMNLEKQGRLKALHADGLLNGEIAAALGVSNSTVSKWMDRLNLTRNTQHARRVQRIASIAAKVKASGRPIGAGHDRPVVPIRHADPLLERLKAGMT